MVRVLETSLVKYKTGTKWRTVFNFIFPEATSSLAIFDLSGSFRLFSLSGWIMSQWPDRFRETKRSATATSWSTPATTRGQAAASNERRRAPIYQLPADLKSRHLHLTRLDTADQSVSLLSQSMNRYHLDVDNVMTRCREVPGRQQAHTRSSDSCRSVYESSSTSTACLRSDQRPKRTNKI